MPFVKLRCNLHSAAFLLFLKRCMGRRVSKAGVPVPFVLDVTQTVHFAYLAQMLQKGGRRDPATARFGTHHRSCLINTRSSADTLFIPRMSSSPQFIWVKRVFFTSRKRTTQFLIPSDLIKGIKTAVPPACQATRRAWRPATTGQRPCRGSPPVSGAAPAALVSRAPARPPPPAFCRPGL